MVVTLPHCLIFAGKSSSLPLDWSSIGVPLKWAISSVCKYQTRMEGIEGLKHLSLLPHYKNFGREKLYSTLPMDICFNLCEGKIYANGHNATDTAELKN
jgi:hypothetical protein